MQLSIAVSNLRRLRSTPSIKLRPITILVGKNSVGKSTFLRTFPLIRQSLETKSSAPILWYGDYVDFGNFSTAVSNKDKNNKIKISFRLEDYEYQTSNQKATSSSYNYFNSPPVENKFKEINIEFTICERNKKTILERVKIESSCKRICFDIMEGEQTKIFGEGTINNEDIQKLISPYNLLVFNDQLFTPPAFVRRLEHEKMLRLAPIDSHRVFQSAILRILKTNIADGRIKDDTLKKESQRILREQSFEEENITRLERANTEAFKKFYGSMKNGNKQEERKKIDSIIKLRESINAYEAICKSLILFFEHSDYIGPARARSERYYREQELEVSDISPDGRNLPMFLASLQDYQRNEFSVWVEKVFGFGIKILNESGHISIELTQNGQLINVADTGYGISQVLPVLAQTWWKQQPIRSTFHKQNDSNLTARSLVIEQPELHLHPAHQALLADIFAQTINQNQYDDKNNEIILVIETHSESLINRLGELIDNGKIQHKDVQIIVFEDSNTDKIRETFESNVITSTFEDDGTLVNWPYGFFDYE